MYLLCTVHPPSTSILQYQYGGVFDGKTSKKSIPYGCSVDHKVKYDIEKVEYFDEKCETKYK